MQNPQILTSISDEWRTPECVLERVRRVGPIALDPCSGPGSIVHARVEWTEADDGLTRAWEVAHDEICFVNPPYGRELPLWVAHCMLEDAVLKTPIVLLVPARTDTRWWHDDVVQRAAVVCFWRGRLKFGVPPGFVGTATSATFPSAVILWTRHAEMIERFCLAFRDAGALWHLPRR